MAASLLDLQVPPGAMDAPGFAERAAALAVEPPFARPRPMEGLGAARYEAATGRRLDRPDPADPSYDFFDAEAGLRIDLKGPLPPRGGPVPEDRVAGLTLAIVRESNLSTGCDTVLIDMLGLSVEQRDRLRASVTARVRTDKTVAFLEDE